MKFTTFEKVKQPQKNWEGISDSVLSSMPCGLFRADLVNGAKNLLPELIEYYSSAYWMLVGEGHDPLEWEIDVKIHMLMKDQYPCIPNWHCDNVPRVNGNLDYEKSGGMTPMYLFVSGKPTTEFLSQDLDLPIEINSHSDVAKMMKEHEDKITSIEENSWHKFYQNTPHRGTQATENCWRIFIRLTNKSILPVRKTISPMRRHCQVYLNASEFSW